MKQNITVRNYNPRDVEIIMDIFIDAVTNTASKDYSPQQVKAWAQVDRERWLKRCSNRNVWIAEIDGVAAGFTDLENDGHLDMMFVHSRFNNMGVASVLLLTVEHAARKLNLRKIFTEASLTAKPFFEKRGFIVVTQQQVEIRSEVLSNFKMEKHFQ